jgi:fermentation-respiration switch protein FrsA (DUF1100 family)
VWRHGWFCADAASPLLAAAEVKVPVLLVHGTHDWQTPGWHSEELFKRLGSSDKRICWVEGAGHADVIAMPAVWDELARWIESLR